MSYLTLSMLYSRLIQFKCFHVREVKSTPIYKHEWTFHIDLQYPRGISLPHATTSSNIPWLRPWFPSLYRTRPCWPRARSTGLRRPGVGFNASKCNLYYTYNWKNYEKKWNKINWGKIPLKHRGSIARLPSGGDCRREGHNLFLRRERRPDRRRVRGSRRAHHGGRLWQGLWLFMTLQAHDISTHFDNFVIIWFDYMYDCNAYKISDAIEASYYGGIDLCNSFMNIQIIHEYLFREAWTLRLHNPILFSLMQSEINREGTR